MKCVTICNPYPFCIFRLPALEAKRVENRTWGTNFRGDVLVHAGLSEKWMEDAERLGAMNIPGAPEPVKPPFTPGLEWVMARGAIVGVARMVDCVTREMALARWPGQKRWINGPFCWMLSEVREFSAPIPWSGAQGLWEVDTRKESPGAELVRAELEAMGRLPVEMSPAERNTGMLFGKGGRII